MDRPSTLLRRSYERVRTRSPEEQVREVVDHLENPRILVEEWLEAAQTVEACLEAEDDSPPVPELGGEEEEEILLLRFPPKSMLTVVDAEPYIFTTVASGVMPLEQPFAENESPEAFDYLGLIQDRERIAVVGAVESEVDPTPYALLMKLLCGLSEVICASQVERLNRDLYKGALSDQPVIDLHLVVADAVSIPEVPLFQLTHDLADMVKTSLLGQTDFAGDLGRITCLKLPEDSSSEELPVLWTL